MVEFEIVGWADFDLCDYLCPDCGKEGQNTEPIFAGQEIGRAHV